VRDTAELTSIRHFRAEGPWSTSHTNAETAIMPGDIRATYRVQLHAGFGFAQAAAVADYLANLGISHLYGSPYLQAARGSMHGYDVVNHRRVNEELGGAEGHTHFCHALAKHGLGQVLDLVPNHMAITGPENPWWWDVLESGPSSRYAAYFDVDWDPPETRLRNMVLLPVLGNHYGHVLEAGELRLERRGADFTVRYHEHTFPVSPRSLDATLGAAAERCQSDELAFLADACGRLPLSTAIDWVTVHGRHRDKEVLRSLLARLLAEQPAVPAAIDAVITELNADPDALDALLERQNYRLAFWRAAARDLGYRRFFDINTLVALRMQDERVFADTHALALRWVADGVLDGLRIDHPDGLHDPEAYSRRLHQASPNAWILVEKILEPGERLRESWPVAGTTGYDFVNRVGGLFVDPAGEQPLTALYADFTGESVDYRALVRQKKHQALHELLGSDVNRLTALGMEICERDRRHRDYTRYEIHEVLREVIACFPVYRAYVQADSGQVSEDDVHYIDEAVERAKGYRPELDAALFDFLRDLLLLRIRGALEAELVMRFQQLTGPTMAKGVEDTAFYCFNRLISLNEVGGDPSRFGVTPEAFHQACLEAQRCWPRTMLATSTHDTKRSEDVRIRIHLLSEIPERWGEAVRRWAALNERHRRGGWPDRNTEYLLYQTFVGTWPIGVERAVAYMEKVIREAKVHTSWTTMHQEYEEAVRGFVTDVLADREFTAELQAFVAPLIEPGRVNALAQTLLKCTAPGVPDFYQGTELWDLSLVDPDNRRPVDYGLRRQRLDALEGATPEAIWARIDEGLPKLWVIRQALALRRRQPALFGPQGDYQPLLAQGARAGHVVAFARGSRAITVVPRLVLGLNGDWADTTLELPPGRWHNQLSGDEVRDGVVRLAGLLTRFPVSLLVREEAAS
jgi:(1->4)-alpha-D-glucan 1-alpha-D-glucosylmutase